MKTKITAIALVAFSLVLTGFVSEAVASATPMSQGPGPKEGFTTLRGHKKGKGAVVLTWAYADASVSSYTILHTSEDPNDEYAVWNTLATVGGGAKRTISYTDNTVFPGDNHYKIVANSSVGRGGVESPVITITIVSK